MIFPIKIVVLYSSDSTLFLIPLWPTACIYEDQSGLNSRIQSHETANKLEFSFFFLPQLLKYLLCSRQHAKNGNLRLPLSGEGNFHTVCCDRVVSKTMGAQWKCIQHSLGFLEQCELTPVDDWESARQKVWGEYCRH